jgi:hypothetical protein
MLPSLDSSLRINRQQPQGVVALAGGQPVRLEESVKRPGHVQRLGIPRDNDCNARSLHRFSLALAPIAQGVSKAPASAVGWLSRFRGWRWQTIYRRCLYKVVANCISARGRTRVSPRQLSRSSLVSAHHRTEIQMLVLVSLIPLANMVLLAVRGRAFRFVKSSLKTRRHRLRLAAARSHASDGIRARRTFRRG